MAFYLKYRPQRLEDLDLEEVRVGLQKALAAKELPHAFLFAGPRGVGKTSAARIVAKAINCQEAQRCRDAKVQSEKNNKTMHPRSEATDVPLNPCEPCNQCDSCFSITAGTNLDVLEIDAASNRGIDDIRNLREKIKLLPTKSRYKVYIIDEVHMLTNEAFNALLKTLEEPPRHAVFILCTTEVQKLPKTIVSRCLEFNFRQATLEEITQKLAKIADNEGLEVEKKVLREIAREAKGSFRDSQKILEQLSFENKKITEEMISAVRGKLAGCEPYHLLRLLTQKETVKALAELDRLSQSGVNLMGYLEQLLEQLRRVMLAQLGVSQPDQTADDSALPELTEALTLAQTRQLLELFSRAAMELKTAIIPQLPLEMAVIEYCLSSETQKKENQPGELKTDADVQTKQSSDPPLITRQTDQINQGDLAKDSLNFEAILAKWDEILKAVGPKNHSVQAFLRAAFPKNLDEDQTLVLEVLYEFHKTQLESEKFRRIVEEVATVILQKPIKIRCILGEKKPKKEPEKYSLELPQMVKTDDSGQINQTEDIDLLTIAEEIFGKEGRERKEG